MGDFVSFALTVTVRCSCHERRCFVSNECFDEIVIHGDCDSAYNVFDASFELFHDSVMELDKEPVAQADSAIAVKPML